MANPHHELVANRAGQRCEYCHFPLSYSQLNFVCDHIIARKHEGGDDPENLAFCCPHCNSHKLDNIAGLDSRGGDPVRLFNPRLDRWQEHFRWSSGTLLGLTPIGRVTVKVLAINSVDRVRARQALASEGVQFG